MSTIRIARKKQPKLQHRPFYERERELNKMTREDMVKEWRRKMNPYKMKALDTVKDPSTGKETDNPFKYMSIYKIQQFIKTLEAKEDPYAEDNDRIMFAIEMIVTFKDLMRVTTSEAVAVYLLFKDSVEAWIRQNKRDPGDELMAKMAKEAMREFRGDWDKAMKGLETLWRK